MTSRRAAGLAAIVVALAVSLVAPMWVAVLVAAAVAVPVLLVVGFRIEPAVFMVSALALSVFSGYAARLGLPISLDRPLFALTLGALVAGAPLGAPRPRLRFRAVHAWMLVTAGIVAVLALAAGSFESDIGRFAYLDRLGIVPYLAFTLSPLLFWASRQRALLLVALVVVGWYLGITALLEGFGAKELAWPAYINDRAVGLHFDRARGPFAEATAMGISLIGCLVGCVIALRTWRSARAKLAAGLLIPVLALGAIFTLTRAVWLAAIGAAFVGLLTNPRGRRLLLPAAAVGVVAVVAALVYVPGLDERVSERRAEQRAVWDRLNTNAAAVSVFQDKPLVGIGWALFAKESVPYLEMHEDYPLTGQRIEVHNVFLARLAEIGLIGAVPWAIVVWLAIVDPARRRGPPLLEPWRSGLIMYGTAFAIMGMFGPMTAAFPNLLLFLMAGIVAMPRMVVVSRPGTDGSASDPATPQPDPAADARRSYPGGSIAVLDRKAGDDG
jgi:O-antigen ligase